MSQSRKLQRKANKVYGRVKAYLALDFTFGGLAIAIGSWIPTEGASAGFGSKLLSCLVGLAIAAVGVLFYLHSYRKCPDGLKKKCIPSMLLTGLGISMKIAVFFLPAVWKLSYDDAFEADASAVPVSVRDEAGNICRCELRGDFIYISRPNGAEVSTKWEYVKGEPYFDINGERFTVI